MILVDSSVWIDLLGGVANAQTARLEELLEQRLIVGVADLVVTEVLQGTRTEALFLDAKATLERLPLVSVCNSDVSVRAARNYRYLREKGVTVRKTIDTLIATRCIVDGFPLLYRDRDYDHFVRHLGLRSALDDTGGL